jgi:hypothetical protein
MKVRVKRAEEPKNPDESYPQPPNKVVDVDEGKQDVVEPNVSRLS